MAGSLRGESGSGHGTRRGARRGAARPAVDVGSSEPSSRWRLITASSVATPSLVPGPLSVPPPRRLIARLPNPLGDPFEDSILFRRRN